MKLTMFPSMILLTPWLSVLSNPLQGAKVLSRDWEGARSTRAMVKSPQAMPRDSPDGDLTHSVLRRDQSIGFAHLATLLGWQCRLNTNSLCYCMVKRTKESSLSIGPVWKLSFLVHSKFLFPIGKRRGIPQQRFKLLSLGHNFVNSSSHLRIGGFLLRKFDFFNFYMVSSCSILFTDFGTVFVFALG